MERAKRSFPFTLILSGVSDLTDEVCDALFESGCDDSLPGAQGGEVFLDFTREATSLQDAVLSAIADVEGADIGARVKRVEADESVTTAESGGGRFGKLTLDQVLTLLEQGSQRATYGAVAGVVGGIARGVMQGRPKTPRNSWVVAQRTGRPTGYSKPQMHPNLFARSRVIADAAELLRWLCNRHDSDRAIGQ